MIGTNYGAADGNSFNVPDFRGNFARGFNGTNTNTYADPDRETRVALYPGGAIGNNIGSYQSDAYLNHSHNIPARTLTTSTIGDHTHSINYKNDSSGENI